MSGPIDDVADRLQTHASAFVKEKRLPGAALGVVHGGELVWSTGVGFADVDADRIPDTRTLYRVASITKTFTATCIMQLRDKGSLQLDDPVVTYLPELNNSSNPFGPIENVTLRRLLSHESGLMSEPPGTDFTAGKYQGVAAPNLADASRIAVTVPANSQQKYSNLAYQLLGEVVARFAGQPYVDHLRKVILDPLGMSSTAFNPLPDSDTHRCATGYQGRWLTDVLTKSEPPIDFIAEGGLWSCVEDLAKWLAFQTRPDGERLDEEAVLASPTRREMQKPRYLMDDTWSQAFGIGWYAIRKDEATWVQHSGGDRGFITNVCFDPKSGVGAIVLFNGAGVASALSMEIAEIARAAAAACPATIKAPAAMPAEYGEYLGLYLERDFGDLLRLEWRDNQLTLIDTTDPTWHRILKPTDDPNGYVVERGFRESGEVIAFRRNDDSRVKSMAFGGGTLYRLDSVD
jgi:CubicO group peptidase (beta-lactamase class C family)